MSRRALARGVALVLVAVAWLRLPAADRGETSPLDVYLGALIRALGDRAERVRFQAMADLMRLGRPATRELARALLATQPIADTLQVSRSDLAFAVLMEAPDVDVDALLDAYRSAPAEPPESREKIAPPTHSKSEAVTPRWRIRTVLGEVATKPDRRLYEVFEGGDPALRAILAGALGRAGPEAAGAVPFLAKVVAEDGHAEVRAAAADALFEIPEGGTQALRSLLGHADPLVRAAALAAYPANARDDAERIARLLKDPAWEVRRTALLRIENPELAHLHHARPRRASPGQPASTLLAGLPASVLSDLTALARDGDERVRRVAVRALGSLACARRDFAPTLAEALAARVSDPANRVAAEALAQLVKLAEHHVVPRSPGLLNELLRGLAEPSAAGHADGLVVLDHLDLPAARRNEVIDALVTACFSDSWGRDCRDVHKILSRRPAWLEAAVAALASRYSDVRSVDSRALRALQDLGEGSSGLTQPLERLLDHPDRKVRVGAATALARRGYDPARLWGVLMEGARSYGGGWGWDRDAAQTLARLGEPGVARLIAIFRDPATKQRAREVISEALSRGAAESPQTADFFLATVGSTKDPGARAEAVRKLGSLKSRRGDVKAVLERAFASGDAEVRSAVVWTWRNSGQAPGDLVARVFADPSSDVRQKGFLLLSLLPGDDPRRLTFTATALQDTSEGVRDRALRFAGELGETGAALLARYAERGQPLTDGFFAGVERLSPLGDSLVAALEARAADASSWRLDRILSILGRAGAEAPGARKRLYALLDAADPDTRELAARGLLTLREDPWAHDGHLAAALMDIGVHRVVRERLSAALDRLYPQLQIDAASYIVLRAPRIPWPPPPGFRPPMVVPRELFGATGSTTLSEVYKQLASSLEEVSHGFEHGLFLGPTGGFALVARMERIRPDGTPFPEPARWMKKGSPKLSLMDLLTDLFFESPGYFRIIVFAVTSDLVPGHDPRAVLPEPRNGLPKVLDELTRQPFKGKEVLALVYSFERRPDAKVRPWEDGAPSALQHLEKSGVWARLGTRH